MFSYQILHCDLENMSRSLVIQLEVRDIIRFVTDGQKGKKTDGLTESISIVPRRGDVGQKYGVLFSILLSLQF